MRHRGSNTRQHSQRGFQEGEPGDVSTRAVKSRDDAGDDGVAYVCKHDRDRLRLPLDGSGCRGRACQDDVGLRADQLLREHSYPIRVSAVPPKVHPHVAAIGPTQVRKRLRECRVAKLPLRIALGKWHQHADPPHTLRLLRVRRDRPCGRRAAEQGDEAAPFQLIEFRQVAAIRKAHSIPEGGDQVRTCAVQDFGRAAVRCGSRVRISPGRGRQPYRRTAPETGPKFNLLEHPREPLRCRPHPLSSYHTDGLPTGAAPHWFGAGHLVMLSTATVLRAEIVEDFGTLSFVRRPFIQRLATVVMMTAAVAFGLQCIFVAASESATGDSSHYYLGFVFSHPHSESHSHIVTHKHSDGTIHKHAIDDDDDALAQHVREPGWNMALVICVLPCRDISAIPEAPSRKLTIENSNHLWIVDLSGLRRPPRPPSIA
jgi:hypothetical protein